MGVTKEELLNAIQDLSDGGAPTLKEMDDQGDYSSRTYYNHFDSWSDAVRQAGFEPNREPGKRIEKTCEICGESFEVVPSYTEARFCSQECFGKHREGMYTGEDHPRYSERVSVECCICGEEMQKTQNYAERFERYFCSYNCRSEFTPEWFVGERNPQWTEKTEVQCDNCGETHERLPRRAGREWHFCDVECQREYADENFHADGNPNWKGGATKFSTYGPHWEEKRKDVITSQDGECRICTRHRSELESDLHVHHITPVRKFVNEDGDIEWAKANRLENLVGLCGSCHRKWEGIPVVAQAIPDA